MAKSDPNLAEKLVGQVLAWAPVYQFLWLLVFLLAVGAVIGFFFFAESRMADLRSREALEAASEQGWTPHPVKGKYVAEQQITTKVAKTGTIYAQKIRLKENDKVVGEFTIIKVYEGAHWKRGDADALYVGAEEPIDLVAELKTPRFRDLVKGAKQVLCIGLASHFGDEEGNAQLSLRRAQRMRDWLVESDTIAKDVTVVAVPFGRAMDAHPKNDLVAENAQRPAVIIAISSYDDWIDLSTLYDELLKRAQLNTIDLARYSRAGALKELATGKP